MTSGHFASDSSQMVTTAGDVDGVNAEVRGQLSRLHNTVEGLAGSWVGEAKNSFDELMIRWDEAANKLSEALTEIADNIRDNSSNFETGEETGADDFKRVGVAGGSLLNL